MKILVVDDEPDMKEMVGLALYNRGFDVETAASGTEALNKARASLPDAIFLDLLLPDLDGLSVCEILKNSPSTCAIPIIIVTACATEACRLRSFSAGAADFVTKPFGYRSLIARLEKILEAQAAPLIAD